VLVRLGAEHVVLQEAGQDTQYHAQFWALPKEQAGLKPAGGRVLADLTNQPAGPRRQSTRIHK